MRLVRAAAIPALALAVFALAGVTRAGPPNGAFAIDFGPENAVWGGQPFAFDECDDTSCLTLDVSVDPAGKLSGMVEFTDVIEQNGVPNNVQTDGPVKGRARGKAGHSKFKLTSHMKGTVSGGYVFRLLRGRLDWTVEPDANAGTVTTSGKFVLCGGRCAKSIQPPTVDPLEPDDGGPWHLSLELATDEKNRVGGSALATFDDGSEPIEFRASGRYSAKKDESSVTLASTVPGRGARVRLRHLGAAGDSLTRYELSFKIRGQAGSAIALVP